MFKSFHLRGIGFFPAFVQSGTLNHDGKGYPYHHYMKWALPDRFCFDGATDVGKTTTLAPREGNMPLTENLQPKELLPRCIYVNHAKQIALNCVSLSGPGIKGLLERNIYQQKTEPHFISIMAADGKNFQQQLQETEDMAKAIHAELNNFASRFGIEINISCPNTDHNVAEKSRRDDELAHETIEHGRVLRSIMGLNTPIGFKINLLMSMRTLRKIEESRVFDYVMISNTVPWLELSQDINWKKLFGSEISPLTRRGFKQPGGLSGAPLLPLVERFIKEARAFGIMLPIVAGGGILCPDDINRLWIAGANAFSIGSVAFLKPWNIQPIIQRIHSISRR